jgi:hypothetical protein
VSSVTGDLILYRAPDGAVRAEVRYEGDTFWLTQAQMADLFGVQVPAISKHLKNIYESGELSRVAAVSKMETVQIEGGAERRP